MYCGSPSLCLNVSDLGRSARFYEALGMEVLTGVSAQGKRVILRSGGFHLGLFLAIDTNLLNFRGADVRAVYGKLKGRFPGLEGELERYVPNEVNRADFPGSCWATKDPDQNAVLFDTNESEEGESFKARRIEQILSDAEQELVAIGASAECLEVLRTQLIDRFCPSQ